MSVADFPKDPPPGRKRYMDITEGMWANLRSLGKSDATSYQNIFKPAEHPPMVGPARGMAQDEMFGDAGALTGWSWSKLEMGIVGGMVPMTFIGFPALANLSQKAEYRRIVETLATEMTRKWIKIDVSSETDKSDKVKAIEDEMRRLNVREIFKKVAEHDGFFGRGHIYLDWGAAAEDADELGSPIGGGADNISKAKVAGKRLRGLRVIEPVWIYPQEYSSTNALDPNFYRPQVWYVQTIRVHASRLLTFVGRPVSDLLKPAYSFGGIPMTQLAQLYVQNWERIRDAVGKLVESFSVSGLKTKLAEAANAGDNGMNLQRRIDVFNQLRDNLGVWIIDAEEEYFTTNIPLGGLDELQAQAQEHMAAVSGIPLVKLLGLSPHGLNASSEGEIRVFYDWVHAFQEQLFRPQLQTLFEFIQLGLFGDVDPEINFGFEPLWSSSEIEQAQVRQADANTDKTYVDAGVLTAKEVRRKVANDKEMPYSGLDLDDAPDLSETERSENATRMATPILQAYQDGLIKPSKTLEELVEVGVFKTITEEDIQDADNQPPEPDMDAQGGGGGSPDDGSSGPGGGGGPSPQQGPAGGGGARPPGAPNLRLASSNDVMPDALTQLERREVLIAINDRELEVAHRIATAHRAYALDEAGGFTVYHGSPFDIGEFDASRIGSGEGNTTGWNWSYGEGLYFAQNPKVARWYEDELSNRAQLAGKPLALNAATTHIVGHLYTVHVARSVRDFVDWDRPPDVQPTAIRRALVRVLGEEAIGVAVARRRTMGDVLKSLPPGTSEALSNAGIAGVKYLDSQSREAGGGTSNYVVFDPKDVTIVAKDGHPIAQDYDPEHGEKGRFTRKGTGIAKRVQGAPAPRQAASVGQQAPSGGANAAESPEQDRSRDNERVSTRVPTAKGKEDEAHKSADLQVGYESSKASKAAFGKNAALIRSYPGMAATKGMGDDEAVEYFVEHAKNNLLALHDAYPDELKPRGKLWYDGANRIAHEWAEGFGIEPRAVAGVIASLSPQKDWYQNVSLAHRVIDTVKNHSDKETTHRMAEYAEDYIGKLEAKGKQDVADGLRKALADFQGKTLADIKDPEERAIWVRWWDETENTRAFPTLTPEGDELGNEKTSRGVDSRVAWQNFDAIAKAVGIVDNSSQENISRSLGGNHKVRNFYNNIIAPNSQHGDTTVDTHAIGAAHLRPFSGESAEVKQGLGVSGAKDAATGSKGLYGLYSEAYRRAAKERGLLPREMQSVTWEAQRGLFPENDKNEKLSAEIKGLWDEHDAGKRSADDTRRQILARGIKRPSWDVPDGGVHGPKGHTGDAGQLHRAELGAGQGRADGGGRGAYAGTIPLALDIWEEQQHPRQEHGKFTSGAGVARKTPNAPAPGRHHVEFHPVDPRARQPAQLSWESAPGKTTHHMPQFHDAPVEQRREYQREIEKVLADEQGHDLIAKGLGLRTGPTFSAAGVFQGRVNPGAQAQVDVGRLGDDDKAKINAGEAVRAMLLRQDAGAWHKPEVPADHRYLIPGLKGPHGLVFPEDHGEALTHSDAYRAMSPEDQKAFAASGKENDGNYVFKNDKGQVLDRRKARQYAEKEGLLSPIGQGYKQPDLIAEHLDGKASTRFVDIEPKDANMIDFKIGRPLGEEEAQEVDHALSSVQGLDYALVPTPQGWRVLNTGDMPNEQFNDAVHTAMEGIDSTSLPDNVDASREHYVGGYIGNDWSKEPNGESYLQAIGQAGPDVQRSADTLLATLGPKVRDVESKFQEKYGWQRDAAIEPWSKGGPAQDLLARNGGYPVGDDKVSAAAEKIKAKYRTGPTIDKIRDMMKSGVPTNANVKDGGHTLDDGTYTPERTALHEKILNKLFTPDMVQRATPAPGTKPTMTILGGRGGSGKSWITGDDGPVSRKNTLVVDSDEFKQQLPEYAGWNAGLVHEESSHIADRAASLAKKLGVNVAFDQTMKSGTSAPRRMDEFKDTHDLQGYYMHATPEVAADRAMSRFAKGTTASRTGRYVPPEYILGAHNNEKNFDAIIPHLKRWALFDNNGEHGAPVKVKEGKNDRSV